MQGDEPAGGGGEEEGAQRQDSQRRALQGVPEQRGQRQVRLTKIDTPRVTTADREN
jgi:hypothetical protein